VLKHDLQLGEVTAQRNQLVIDEGLLAVEHIDLAVGDFAMHAQHQALALHGFEHLVGLAQIGHASIAVGGCASRVELEGDRPHGLGARGLFGRRVVGQVEHHQRLELHARRHGRTDAIAVALGLLGRDHGRAQVGHHDGAGELPGRGRHHGRHGRAVAHMQVPVIGAGQNEGGRGGGSHGGARQQQGFGQRFSHLCPPPVCGP